MTRKDYALMWAFVLLAGFLGGMFAAFLLGTRAIAKEQDQPKRIIVAEEFRLVDKQGRTRAVLGRDKNNEVGLSLLDDNDVHASLILDAHGGATLKMREHSGKQRVALGILNGAPTLLLMTQNGEGGIGVAVAKDDRADIFIREAKSKKFLWRARQDME